MKNLIRSFYLLLLFMIAISNPVMGQSMGISNTAITPDASSILEMRTSTKGLLIPRMTTTERNAIAAAATGLIIYNTSTSAFNFYNGSSWVAVSSGSSFVNSIAGTANRITIGGTASDPTIDISSAYIGQNSISTLGTISTGTWNGSVINPTFGGTGVNNGVKTITLGGNLITAGAFSTTLTSTAATSITLPTSGTLSTLTGTETLTNKTLTSPVINTPTGLVKSDVGLGNVPNIDATNASNLSSGSIPAARFGNLTVPIAAINATGTPSITSYLRGDGSWATLSGTGITSLNTLTAATQSFATGTTGSDFNISSATATHTFNLPIASGTNTGKLSNTDWTTFNNKQSAFTNSTGLASILSDETGTGLAVFSTSPSLTTPILGVASATSQTINGTTGAGFLELQSQSSAPSSGPANSIRLYSNATGALSWKRSDGFVRTLSATSITADRTYTLPDASGTVAVSASGNIALSASGNITFNGTLPVANGGTNSSTALNNNRIMVSSGGAITEASALTNGQLLIGSTGAAPVAANLTAGNGIVIANTAGTISVGYEAVITKNNASNAITTSSTTDVSISTPLNITPGAGDYLLLYNGTVSNSSNKISVYLSIYVNGVKQTGSEISANNATNSENTISGFIHLQNVSAGQVIDLRWRTDSGIATITNRSLLAQRIK